MVGGATGRDASHQDAPVILTVQLLRSCDEFFTLPLSSISTATSMVSTPPFLLRRVTETFGPFFPWTFALTYRMNPPSTGAQSPSSNPPVQAVSVSTA